MAAAPLLVLCRSFLPSPRLGRLPSLSPADLRLLHPRSWRLSLPSSSPHFASPPLRLSRGFRSPLGTGEDGRPAADESLFLDEDGVVKDMDSYLNYLSLEYDSIWDTKPSWCQPWTILLTGVTVTVCSWAFVHSVIITAATFCLICAWWFIFLYAYPKSYSDMIAQRKQNVVTGADDTFGVRKNQ